MSPTSSTTTTTTTASNIYVLTASIAADGSLQLSGPGLVDNVIETPRGEDAIVKIPDIEGLYLYGTEIPIRGADTGCWKRTDNGKAKRRFPAVTSDIVNITYAASTNDTAKVKYGPVITIKPKG